MSIRHSQLHKAAFQDLPRRNRAWKTSWGSVSSEQIRQGPLKVGRTEDQRERERALTVTLPSPSEMPKHLMDPVFTERQAVRVRTLRAT